MMMSHSGTRARALVHGRALAVPVSNSIRQIESTTAFFLSLNNLLYATALSISHQELIAKNKVSRCGECHSGYA